jgi:ABC-2 type transport system ATP-binding protein
MHAANLIAHDIVAGPGPALLRVSALAKRYRDQEAIADVSFSVAAGEILGLIGPNGAGKTTLLEIIAGLLPSDGGEAFWRGVALSPMQRREFIFYLPDGVHPWDDQYVARVLQFFADVYGRSRQDVAGMVCVAPVMGKRIIELSKGFSRRLLLALALLTPHPLLLMDEPFDGFDLRQARDIMGLLRDIAATGRTLILAIHQLADAERVADRFVLLAHGRLRGAGTLDELRTQTALPRGSLEEIFLALT